MGKSKEENNTTNLIKEMLIQLVKEQRTIWDISAESYFKRDITNNCWAAILEELQKHFSTDSLVASSMHTVEKLKSTFRNMRSTYQREKRSQKGKSGDGLKDVATPKWPFFSQMSFLDEGGVIAVATDNSFIFYQMDNSMVQACGDGTSEEREEQPNTLASQGLVGELNLLVSKNASTEDNKLEESTEMDEKREDSTTEMNNRPEESTEMPMHRLTGWDPSRQLLRKGKKRKGMIADREDQRQKRQDRYAQSLELFTKGEDEDGLFGKLIAEKMRGMNRQQKGKIQQQLLQVINATLDEKTVTIYVD